MDFIVEHSMPLLLFFTAVTAGFIDTLAGGGGLLTIPALMMSGLPPLTALGTNKMQGCFGSGTASLMMFKKKRIRFKDVRWLMLRALIGSAAGAGCVQLVNTEALSFIIPAVLLGIAIYFIIPSRTPEPRPEEGVHASIFRNAAIPGIGFYDGMFGPGTGSFLALAGVQLRGWNIIQATAVAKPLNFTTNVAALTIFISAGHVAWLTGLIMMAGQAMGAWLGAHCLFKTKPVILRMLIVLMSVAMLTKYAFSMGWL